MVSWHHPRGNSGQATWPGMRKQDWLCGVAQLTGLLQGRVPLQSLWRCAWTTGDISFQQPPMSTATTPLILVGLSRSSDVK